MEFKEKLAIALPSNPEFIKAAIKTDSGKQTWYAVSHQLNRAVNEVQLKGDRDE